MINYLRNRHLRGPENNPLDPIAHDPAAIIRFFKKISPRDLHFRTLNPFLNASLQALFELSGAEACTEQERILRVFLIARAKDPSFNFPNFLTGPLMKKRMEDTEGSFLHKIYCSLMIFHWTDPNSPENILKQTFITTLDEWITKSHTEERYHLYNAIAPLIFNRKHIVQDISFPHPIQELVALSPLYEGDEINKLLQLTLDSDLHQIQTLDDLAKILVEFCSDEEFNDLVKFITSCNPNEMTDYFFVFINTFMFAGTSRYTQAHFPAINDWIIKYSKLTTLEHMSDVVRNFIKTCTKDNANVIYTSLTETLISTSLTASSQTDNTIIERRICGILNQITSHHGIADKKLINRALSNIHESRYTWSFLYLLEQVEWEEKELENIHTQLKSKLNDLTAEQKISFTMRVALSFLHAKNKAFKNNTKTILLSIKDVTSISERQIIEALYTPGYSGKDLQEEIESLLSIFITSDKTTHVERSCGMLSAIINAAPLETFKHIDIKPFIAATKVFLEETKTSTSIHALACQAIVVFIPKYNDDEFDAAAQILIDFQNRQKIIATYSATNNALIHFANRNEKIDQAIKAMLSNEANVYLSLEYIALLLKVAKQNDEALESFLDRYLNRMHGKELRHFISLIFDKFSQDKIPQLLEKFIKKIERYIISGPYKIELMTGILASKSICTPAQKEMIFKKICEICNESAFLDQNIVFIAEKALPHVLANGLNPAVLTSGLRKKGDALERLAIELVTTAYVAVAPQPTEEAENSGSRKRTHTQITQ